MNEKFSTLLIPLERYDFNGISFNNQQEYWRSLFNLVMSTSLEEGKL